LKLSTVTTAPAIENTDATSPREALKKSIKPEVENEIKLILHLHFNPAALEKDDWTKSKIKQVYLPQHPRYRREKTKSKPALYTENTKDRRDPLAPLEWERRTGKSIFQKMWDQATEKQRVRKVRYTKQYGDETWCVDFFHNKKGEVYFAMAEVEMPKGQEKPKITPLIIGANIAFRAPRDDNRFTSRKLADPHYAHQRLQEIQRTVQVA